MIDCLLVTKPEFEWVSYLPYLVLSLGLVLSIKNWKKWKAKSRVSVILTLLAIFALIWILTFIFTPTTCAALL